MGQIITTQNLVAIKEVRHAGQQGTLPMVFCDHTIGGNVARTLKTNLLHEESVT